jgi:hypothetical protein
MSPIRREYYRVPRQDRAAYVRPAPEDLPALVEANRRLLGGYGFTFGGLPVAEFRARARREVLALACAYTARWGFAVPQIDAARPLILTGHQPPPFHAGVWIKNFLASRLARAVGGVSLNLTVDNDEVHAQAFTFPVREGDAARLAQVEFAPHGGGLPFEEQPVGRLRAEAVHDVLAQAPAPCREPFRLCWTRLVAAVSRAGTLGEAFAVARRAAEEDLGATNLELPVSAMADGEAFRLFVAATIARHEDLVAAYNGALAEYRHAYRERSAAQPVPDLARDGRRAELPYWVWREGEARRRLWLHPCQGRLLLEADREPVGVLGDAGLTDVAAAAERLAEFRRGGWKIRPRALTLTLFVRVCLGDVFIHGLGGALYDKVTDAMIERFFGVQPPGLVLASCTVHLPLEGFAATGDDLRRACRTVRDWRFNPGRMMDEAVRETPEAAALIAEKHRLLADRAPERDGRRRAFHRVHEINARLADLQPQGPRAAAEDLARTEREVRAGAVLRNREVPFCFHRAEDLAAFYRRATPMPGLEPAPSAAATAPRGDTP